MRRIALASLHLMAMALYGAVPESGQEALRKLVRLPTVNLVAGFNFTYQDGLQLLAAESDSSSDITATRRKLRGDLSDADHYYRLSKLHKSAGNEMEAKSALKKSTELSRKRVELQPRNGQRLAELGEALSEAGNTAEGESILRGATTECPDEWRVWSALGRVLDSKAGTALCGAETNSEISEINRDWLTELFQRKPPAAQVLEASLLIEEANRCFDKAVSIAPEEPAVYLKRGLHHAQRSLFEAIIEALRDESPRETERILMAMYSTNTISDFHKVSELSPTDYTSIAVAAALEAYSWRSLNWHQSAIQTSLWEELPEKTKSSIREAITRLENLGHDSNTRLAAGACEALAVLQAVVMQNWREVQANARRAVALDSSREKAWDLLTASLVQREDYAEIRSVCGRRLRVNDSARTRLMLAKAEIKLDQVNEARRDLAAALKNEPNNFLANLAMAAFRMRYEKDAEELSDVQRLLVKAGELLLKNSKSPDARQRATDYSLAVGLYYGLAGKRDLAVEFVSRVLKNEPKNEHAKEILAALQR